MLNSPPINQPQPSLSFYDLSHIALFTDYTTRAMYKAASGDDPPTGDRTKRPKYWADTSLAGKDPSGTASYAYVDRSSLLKPVIAFMSMTVAEAMSVNIPGVHSYPPYAVAPTLATSNGVPINSGYLSTRDDALALAIMWGFDSSAVVEPIQALFPIFDPPTEIRREYSILFKDVPCNVGVFLGEMYHNGVGTPGHWDLTGPEPNWISDQPSPQTFILPPWPDPVRTLLPNEKLNGNIFGGVIVYRTDMESAYNPTIAYQNGSGGLTAAQTAELHHTYLGMNAILAAANITI